MIFYRLYSLTHFLALYLMFISAGNNALSPVPPLKHPPRAPRNCWQLAYHGLITVDCHCFYYGLLLFSCFPQPQNPPAVWWLSDAYICVSKLSIIVSDNGLSPGRCQAIIWSSAGILVNWTTGNKLQRNINQNSSIFIHDENAFEMLYGKWRPFCLGLNVLRKTKEKKAVWCWA